MDEMGRSETPFRRLWKNVSESNSPDADRKRAMLSRGFLVEQARAKFYRRNTFPPTWFKVLAVIAFAIGIFELYLLWKGLDILKVIADKL